MRINAVITEQAVNPKGLADILGKLNIGDVVKAKVLEITSGELMLKLFDGTVFKAATTSELDTSPGESLNLLVKGKSDGTLILETVKKETSIMDSTRNEALKLLDALNINQNPKNIELAGEIKSAGINATKELFEKASQLIDKFKSLTPEKAVFLSSRSIAPESGSIDTVIRLIEGTLKLGSQLDELHSIISKIADENSLNKASQNSREGHKKPEPVSSLLITDNADALDNTGNKLQSDKNTLLMNKSELKEPLLKNNNLINNEVITDTDLHNADSLKAQQKTLELKSNEFTQNKQLNTAISKEISDIHAEEANIIKNTNSQPDLLIYKSKSGGDIEKDTAELLGKLKDTFKSMFVKTDSENLSSELEVKKLYKDIIDKLEGIKNITRSLNLPAREDITTRVNTIEDGIKLLNQIGSSNTYVQIPLNIAGYNTTGDLYILKKDRNKKRIDPQNVIMLLSLDTQNLGRIESLIDVKGKNVGINLKAEEQKVVDFIRENYRHLYNSLLEKGYRLVDIKYRLLEEKSTPVNAERTVRKELSHGHISVDYKI